MKTLNTLKNRTVTLKRTLGLLKISPQDMFSLYPGPEMLGGFLGRKALFGRYLNRIIDLKKALGISRLPPTTHRGILNVICLTDDYAFSAHYFQ